MRISPTKDKEINFQSTYFEDYNSKYNNIRSKVQTETERFFQKKNNVSKIGEGVGGETYKFSDWKLNNLVIKTTKPNYKDDYFQEYNNLMSVPSDKIGGQEAVARVYDSSGRYGLISTLVQGKPASIINRYNDSHLKSLFNKMFELDKAGIYHGDLNGNNILLNNSGSVNFIDYQWTQIVPQSNFYDSEKVSKMLLPRSVFPENAQMFEMASLPYYVDKLWTSSDKENFLKKYLRVKSEYHDKRAKYVATLEPNWPYSGEKYLLQQSIREERAKANVYRNPDDSVLKLELKKLQFLSDYRDAYSHVDANMPDRNIIPSSSSYLCAMSSVQEFRKEIAKELRYCINSDKKQYLKSLEEYGDYWYSNLQSYTSDTFDYVMRAILNKPSFEESKHRFYINDRDPRNITPNRDILANVSSKFKTTYDRNFDVPNSIQYTISNIYDDAARSISSTLSYDTKSQHNVDKIKSISKESKKFNGDSRYLDLLNVSQVGVLKIREFYGYVRHNLSSYSASNTLDTLLDKSSDFTRNLFSTIFNGLKQYNAENILVKGYSGMRQFKGKI